MRRPWALLVALSLLAACAATERPATPAPLAPSPSCEPIAAADSSQALRWRTKVAWRSSLEEARRVALAEGKLVFCFQVVGNLDEEGV